MHTTEWLNYHHLYYFWVTAKEGSLSRASTRMKLTRSTLSAQIHSLEGYLGGELFLRSGRALSLTALGLDVLQYADSIFRTGSELVDMVHSKQLSRRAPLRLGVVAGMPKVIAYRLLEPALSLAGHAPISLRQDGFARLLDDLLAGSLHLVLSNCLPPQGSTAGVFAQTLCQSAVHLYGVSALAKKYGADFPQCLNDAPFLLPAAGSPLRSAIDSWLHERGINVSVEGEFDDAAMMRVFGLEGRGLFPMWAGAAAEDTPGVQLIGEFDGVLDRFYALSTERRMCRAELRAVVEHGRARRRQ